MSEHEITEREMTEAWLQATEEERERCMAVALYLARYQLRTPTVLACAMAVARRDLQQQNVRLANEIVRLSESLAEARDRLSELQAQDSGVEGP